MPIYSSSHTVLHQCATFITVDEPVLINVYLFIYLFIWLHRVVEACGIFRCGAWAFLKLWHVGVLSLVAAPGLQGAWALYFVARWLSC